MILVWGSRADAPVERVLEALQERGADVFHIDRNALATLRYDVTFDRSPHGWIETNGRRIAIDALTAAYLRPNDPHTKTPLAAMTLLAVASSLPGIVVNRVSAGRSNASKPYQLGIIERAGLEVPDTLVTTDPEAARRFLHEHGRLVYKSLSGIRSVVATLDARDEERLDDVRTGPVQLQAYIDGLDVRVHVVGERLFGCSVRSSAADYRYAAQSGASADLQAYDVPDDIGRKIVALTRSMNLLVAGVDLRVQPDGRWVCFEVNPSPGFPWYEDAAGHDIADAIAELLMSGAARD